MKNTTMNTGAASLLPCPFCGCSASPELNGNGIGDNWLECVECGASTRLREDGAGSVKDWNRRASTPQADAAPIINGHAINDLFLKWSEWTTELGEAISRKNIDGFVSELRAAIAAGGAQEPADTVSLTGAQLLEAFQFVAPDHPNDADQLECEVTIQRGNGHDGPGLYCWITEYPEEGAIRLDADPAAASNGEQETGDA